MSRVCHDGSVNKLQTAAFAPGGRVDGHQDLSAEAAFEPEPKAVAAARRFVRETLISWGLPGRDDLVADAVLLASELVTNAIVHAGTPVQLTCSLDGEAVAADAAYALIADEGGELRMRAAAGRGVPQLQLGGAAASAADHARGANGMGTFLDLYNQFAERGADLAQIQNEPLLSLL